MFSHIADFLNRSPPDPVRLPFTSSHWPVLIILTTYMVLIKIVGPMFMQNRKPYDLLGIIKAYNIMQIIYNTVSLVFVSDLEVLLVMNINLCISQIIVCALYAWTWKLQL